MDFAAPTVQLADHVPPGKSLTISRACMLLSMFPEPHSWMHVSEFEMLSSGVENAKMEVEGNRTCSSSSNTNKEATLPSDPREEPLESLQAGSSCKSSSSGMRKTKIYCDYQLILDLVGKEDADVGLDPFTSRYEFVCDKSDADFLLILEHVRNFLSLPLYQRVCQFPYEGGIVRKDLLPLTVRKHCYTKGGVSPYWWLPCYDLSTEFHLFSWEYKQNELKRQAYLDADAESRVSSSSSSSSSNNWIIKPAQLAQARGHKVFPQNKTCLKDMAMWCAFSDGGDKVAQKLVSKPALIRNRKIDLRVAVSVRSFAAPFEAYMSEYFYARLANKEYKVCDLTDPETVLTVNAYGDESIANKQERESYEGLASALGLDNYVIDERSGEKMQRFKLVEEAIVRLMSHLFSGAGRSVGKWPRSSAYYCVDVILDWDYDCDNYEDGSADSGDAHDMFHTEWFRKMNIPVPRLIEVNFMGDLHGFEAAMHTLPPYDGTRGITAFHKWAAELVNCTVSNEANPKGFVRLEDFSDYF